jgi:hypothetical protein
MAIEIQAPSPRKLPALRNTPSSEERPSLPPLTFDISRPSSASTQASSRYSQLRHSSNNTPTIQLPALSTLASLASLASKTPPAETRLSNGYVIVSSQNHKETSEKDIAAKTELLSARRTQDTLAPLQSAKHTSDSSKVVKPRLVQTFVIVHH